MKSFALLSALFVSLASAITQPVGEPSGNPIAKPGLGEIVPVGAPYTITWNPTTPGTISIRLMRGPGENIVPHSVLVEGIANSGTYVWTPPKTLEPDTSRYGLQLIVDSTGQYQWSTQFGISNPDYNGGQTDTDTATATETGTATRSTTVAGSATTTETETDTTTTEPETSTIETSTYANKTTTVKTTSTSTTEAETTSEAETTFYTTTVLSTTETERPTSRSSSPAPTATDSGVSSVGASYGMGLVAVAVAGFSLWI